VRAIDEQVSRMRAVIRGFLALARGEAPELRAIDASVVARDAEQLVRHRFDQAGITLEVSAARGRVVACDRMLLTQVMVNLLQNACDAADVERVTLSLADADPFVEFRVVDDGAGISDDVAQSALEPFFTTRARAGGSGLGLALAREIVSHHAGSITIERRSRTEGDAARGTVVVVRIPSSKEVPS
jgi:two-component system sporulation sensor kinase A